VTKKIDWSFFFANIYLVVSICEELAQQTRLILGVIRAAMIILQLKVDRRVKLKANGSYKPTIGISWKDKA